MIPRRIQGRTEFRRIGCDNHVAEQCQPEPATHRETTNRDHDWFLDAKHR